MTQESQKKSAPADFDRLSRIALDIRRDVIKMLGLAGSGHPGGSLSATDILTALYFQVMRHDPKNPKWADRDRLVFSKGHGCPALYSALARAGYFSVESLLTLRKLESPLQGHPDVRRLAGIDASTGSLGQGLSIAVGMGLAARFDRKDYFSWALISDGELNEGQIWEAAAFASFHKMTNVPTILDYNKYQLGGSCKEMLDMEPVVDKWKAFGWETREINGHDLREIHDALLWAKSSKSAPRIIIAHTVKGKGVSFMEGNNHFHGVANTKDETVRALKELGESDAEIARITGMMK
ncbi:MAG TPA: transketolase [Candidatus Eisenbacteria bacterium]|nr:transketolase [Candidatus Eisenbacteria bacterium]